MGLWSVTLAVFLGVVLMPALASAQANTTRPPLSLTTSPIPLNVVTKPGKTITADLRVKNNGTTPEKLKIELLKFGANGTSGNPQLQEREPKDTYFDWVSFSENTFTAEPNVWKTVKMTIKAPPEAAFGYYLAVLFSRATPDKPTGGASAVEGGVASLVLLDVDAPGAKREAKVAALTADRKVYEFLPANLDIRLRNSGNTHVSPTGSIFIKRGEKQIAVLEFNTQRGNILPGTNRSFTSGWNDGFPHYEVKTEGTKTTKDLKWNFSDLQKFRMGRYTATLVAVYDNGQRDVPIEATVSFWVIPWRILGVALLILLLVGAGVWMIIRSIWKNLHPGGRGKNKRERSRRPGKDDDDENDDSDDVSSMETVKQDQGVPAEPEAKSVTEAGPDLDLQSAPPEPPEIVRSARPAGSKADKTDKPAKASAAPGAPPAIAVPRTAKTDASTPQPKTAPELKD
jgi:hypothetical protein